MSLAFAAAGAGGTPSRIPGGGVLVTEASPTPQPEGQATGPCQLPAGDPGAPGADLTLTGACTGAVGTFTCTTAADDVYLAAEEPLAGGKQLYLSFNVESYTTTGREYAGVQLIIEVSGSGPLDLHSWQNYALSAHLNTDGSLTVPHVRAASPSGGPPVDVEGIARCR